jgi:hypothetical protein
MNDETIIKQDGYSSNIKKILLAFFGTLGVFFSLFVLWVSYIMWFSS